MDPNATQWINTFNIGGINLFNNPMYHSYESNVMQSDGELIRAVNVDSQPLGAKNKRAGYTTFLGTTNNGGSSVNNLFSWTQDNGTSIFLYAYSGGRLNYYDAQAGTATDWLPMGNGTFGGGTHVGYTVLNNVMICGDGVGSTRHSTDGTSLTNTSGAPAAEHFEQYQQRVYTAGTTGTSAAVLSYSSFSDATNWSGASPSDSSAFSIPGQGKIMKLFKTGDRLHIAKYGRNIFRWDGYTLVDLATNMGPSSPYSFGTSEDTNFYLNNLGINICDPNGPQLISTPIRPFIYNEAQTGIAGSVLGTAPGGAHRYDYYVSVGSVQDDFTNEPLNNGIIKYNYQKNEFLMYQFNDNPTAYASYYDKSGSQQMIFGNSAGQVFTYGGSQTSDNGVAIGAVIELVYNFNAPQYIKEWRWFFGYFNPGCEAQVSIAAVDTFTKGKKNWIDLGDATSGVLSYRFPTGLRSRLLYLRIREASKTSRFTWYGCTIGAKFVPIE